MLAMNHIIQDLCDFIQGIRDRSFENSLNYAIGMRLPTGARLFMYTQDNIVKHGNKGLI